MPSYKNRQCKFCDQHINYVDYKNVRLIRKYLTQYMKIVPKYYSGNCRAHQNKLASAVKNARIMALIPFISQ